MWRNNLIKTSSYAILLQSIFFMLALEESITNANMWHNMLLTMSDTITVSSNRAKMRAA